MFTALYNFLIASLVRIYKLLPSKLRRRILRLFVYMFVLGMLEALCILSLSFLAMSIAAPEAILSQGISRAALRAFPSLNQFIQDPRSIALITSCIVVGLTCFKNIISAFVSMQGSRVGEDIGLHAGESVLHHYLTSSYLWHLSSESAPLFQALSWRNMLGQVVINLFNLYTYSFISFLLFITLVASTPGTIIGTLVAVGLITYGIYKSIKNFIDISGITVAESSFLESKTTLNAVNGIREIIIYRQSKVFFDKFAEACKLGRDGRAFLNIASSIPPWFMEVLGFSLIPATMFLMIKTHDASMAEMTGILTLIMLACWRILPLFNRSLSCVVSIRSILPMVQTTLDRLEHCAKNPSEDDVDPDPSFTYVKSIELSDLTFTYPGAAVPAVQDVSLHIAKGTQVGIIGPSGAGKSSLAAILCGLLPPSSGSMSVDGLPLTAARTAAYRLRVGYVPQTPYIMPGTLAENVAFSQWGKPWDEQRVWSACRMAALDVVQTHPQGILLPIGERGAGLSGGQIQRVSIARALYVNPEVLILDEATSSLDQATEAEIINAINALRGKITVIMIAHRLTTVAQCDLIYRVEDSRVVDAGSPSVVLPRYADFMKKNDPKTS